MSSGEKSPSNTSDWPRGSGAFLLPHTCCREHRVFPCQRVRLVSFQDLNSALKGALSGSLEALMLGLMKSTAQYDATELKASMKVQKLLTNESGRLCPGCANG